MAELKIKCEETTIRGYKNLSYVTVVDPDIALMIEEMDEELYDKLLQELQNNLSPEDIFTENQLNKWAEANDYIKNIED